MGDRGWAQRLLVWTWRGVQLEASIARCTYYVRPHGRHEVIAHAELRDFGGRYRIEIGSFPDVAAARAACERDAQRRCRRDDAAEAPAQAGGPPVSVAIAPGRRRGRGNFEAASKSKPARARPRDPVAERDLGDALAAFDAALAAFADVVGEE